MYIKAKKRKRRTRNGHPASELGFRDNSHLFQPWHGRGEAGMVLNKGTKLCGQRAFPWLGLREFPLLCKPGIVQALKSLWEP